MFPVCLRPLWSSLLPTALNHMLSSASQLSVLHGHAPTHLSPALCCSLLAEMDIAFISLLIKTWNRNNVCSTVILVPLVRLLSWYRWYLCSIQSSDPELDQHPSSEGGTSELIPEQSACQYRSRTCWRPFRAEEEGDQENLLLVGPGWSLTSSGQTGNQFVALGTGSGYPAKILVPGPLVSTISWQTATEAGIQSSTSEASAGFHGAAGKRVFQRFWGGNQHETSWQHHNDVVFTGSTGRNQSSCHCDGSHSL